MKVAVACVLVAALMGGVVGDLLPPERSYDILVLYPVATKSHVNVFRPLVEALADRGHKVVVLTCFPKAYSHPNITEVHHGLGDLAGDDHNMFEERKNPSSGYSILETLLPTLARDLYMVPAVKELFQRRKEFDLMIINQYFSEISAQFPELPPLLELERNQSLSLLNTHFSIDRPVPLLSSQVEVGAMHCHPAKPLPEDLESWVAGAGSAGVIYFSLGSVVRGVSMPLEYREAFLQAFRRLPQRVLWKYEGELEGVPDNVRISSWMPQQDILAHHNVKVFISHGGLLSLQESLYHGTPLLSLPVFVDQSKNGLFVEESGLGHMLLWEELSADKIVDALIDIMNNPKYKENVARMSGLMRDQLTTPQERAVFWTEYVIRHRGAPQLRSPAAQLSWVEFLLLDVLLLLLVALLVLLFILRRVLRVICSKVFGGARDKQKRD